MIMSEARHGADDVAWPGHRALAPLFSMVIAALGADAPDMLAHLPKQMIRNRYAEVPEGTAAQDAGPRFILRRLSRESLALCHEVHETAAFLAKAWRQSPRLQARAAFSLPPATEIDRPSLRVLLRWAALTPQRERPALYFAASSLDDTEAMYGPLAASRRKLLDQLCKEWAVQPAGGNDLHPTDYPPDTNDIAAAFAEQNHERVLALVRSGATVPPLPGATIEALILVNLGAPDAAVQCLESALQQAHGSSEQRLLHYLLALILTKRAQSDAFARHHFSVGLALCETDDRQTRLDRAWLYNGQALANALAARGAPDRTARLTRLIEGQNQILELALSYDDEEFLYLRYNVLANTTLLLEMLSAHAEASAFWRRAFAASYGNAAADRAGAVHYHYRDGMLAGKAGKWDEACLSLSRAMELTGTPQSLLLAPQTARALAWAERGAGRNSVATSHLESALESAVALADPDEAEAARIMLHYPTAPSPSSKLPSFFPHVDLDATPGQSINAQLLASVRA